MLDGRGVNRFAHQVEQARARRAILAQDANLDELVRAQRDVDLVHHRRRETVLANCDDGIQMMRPGAQRAAGGGVERRHGAQCTARASGYHEPTST